MERQHFYISMTGLTEEQIQEELSTFLNDLVQKYEENKFGATVLGITEDAAKRVEKMLNE
ncbi:hypothetical protein [Oceanobacillus salinisoli]|uniref:hypothetical protein n=1 Tax=Oceanobacillus salinisoli TaxID=2678611 RepID=UPI0012E19DDE|nr:hypothetical protein [Oceanobacillus salinisoli]